jgi:hypothetical protein
MNGRSIMGLFSRKYFRISNAFGFTLLEVMIAVGLLVVVMLGFIEFLKSSSMGMKTLNAQDNSRVFVGDVCQDLTSSGGPLSACQYTFQSAYSTLSGGSAVAISSIQSASNNPRYSTGSTYANSLVLKGMNIGDPVSGLKIAPAVNSRFNLPDWDPSTGLALLTVHWQQTGVNGNVNAGMGLQDFYRYTLVKFTPIAPVPHFTCTCIGSGGGQTIGSGTPGTIIMWGSSGTSLADSVVSQSATGNIGVGTVAPTDKLTVNGSTALQGAVAITGNTTMSGSASVGGNSTVSGSETIGSNSSIGGNEAIGGNASVGGTLKMGGASVGGACSTEGTFAYDYGNHKPLYCPMSGGSWTALGGGGASVCQGQGGAFNGQLAVPSTYCTNMANFSCGLVPGCTATNVNFLTVGLFTSCRWQCTP